MWTWPSILKVLNLNWLVLLFFSPSEIPKSQDKPFSLLIFDCLNSYSEVNCLHMNEHLQSENYGTEECWKEMFSFIVETMETAVKAWHETSKVDTRVYFLLNKEKTQTDKYAPAVNIDKVFKEDTSHLEMLQEKINLLFLF